MAANVAKMISKATKGINTSDLTNRISEATKGINTSDLTNRISEATKGMEGHLPSGSTIVPVSQSSSPHFTDSEVEQIKVAIDKVFDKHITQAKLNQLMIGWFDSLKLGSSQLNNLADKFMGVLSPSLQMDFTFKQAILKQLLSDQEIRSVVDDPSLSQSKAELAQGLKKLLEKRFQNGGGENSPAEELLNLKLERLVEADLPKIFDEAMQKYIERYAKTPNADIDQAIREKSLAVIGSLPIANFKFFILYNLLQDTEMIGFINKAVSETSEAYSTVLLNAITTSNLVLPTDAQPLPIGSQPPVIQKAGKTRRKKRKGGKKTRRHRRH